MKLSALMTVDEFKLFVESLGFKYRHCEIIVCPELLGIKAELISKYYDKELYNFGKIKICTHIDASWFFDVIMNDIYLCVFLDNTIMPTKKCRISWCRSDRIALGDEFVDCDCEPGEVLSRCCEILCSSQQELKA